MKFSNLKTRLLLGAAATLAAAAGMVGAANAGNTIYGGGSSLAAPYIRQSGDCWGQPTPLVIKAVPPVLQSYPGFNYTGAQPQDCSTTHYGANTVKYISTGSGTGIAAMFSHDTSKYGDVDPTTDGNQFFPSVNYGASDASLGTSDVAIYNHGGTEQGVTVVDQGVTPGAGQYANPREKFGALIQVPLLIAPVAIAYDPVYKKVRNGDGSVTEYRFNVKAPRADGSGGLRLDSATYCKIFNGEINNWKALKSLNGGLSLEDPADPTPAASWGVPLQIVGRSDSSGTTSIFSRHIAAVCASTSGNQYADAATLLPAALQGSVYDKTTANSPPVAGETTTKFTLASGNDGVAKYIDFTADPGPNAGDSIVQGRIGYLGPDYALPAVTYTGANTYGLNTANLKNSNGQYMEPSTARAIKAFGALTPPDSLANGHYDAASSDPRDRSNPQDWVEPASKTSALANPSALGAYPIVGTTNLLAYTCYATTARTNVIRSYLSWYYTNPVTIDATNGLLAKSGFAPMPGPWRIAIHETFSTNTSGLGLDIYTKGSGSCTDAAIVGG